MVSTNRLSNNWTKGIKKTEKKKVLTLPRKIMPTPLYILDELVEKVFPPSPVEDIKTASSMGGVNSIGRPYLKLYTIANSGIYGTFHLR